MKSAKIHSRPFSTKRLPGSSILRLVPRHAHREAMYAQATLAPLPRMTRGSQGTTMSALTRQIHAQSAPEYQ